MHTHNTDSVCRKGVVIAIQTSSISVKIENTSACHSCRAKQFCGISEKQKQIIEIFTPNPKEYKTGEKVRVGIRPYEGWFAVGLAYIVPLLLLLMTVAVGVLTGLSEINSGISAIIVLISYYLGLFSMRNKLKNKIMLTVEKDD